MKRISLLSIFICLVHILPAQYFGRNKPRYQNFNFKVKETQHFDLHYYARDRETVDWFGQLSEQWYDLHGGLLNHNIPFKNPIILYNNHAEFQQTNAISGAIGVGTGGVTEGYKNRVIMPLTFSNQQTQQVLGHELVHAFQFNMIIGGDSTSIRSLANLPLWVVEGMAEYMSLGRVDPFTSMWMRNAIINDDVPSLQKMANPKYFPYRYGQAAWSFLTGYYGDEVIKPFFMNTAMYGMDYASDLVFGVNLKTLSGFWENALRTYYEPYLNESVESTLGKTLLSKKNSGRINVSPALSPNGRYVIFLSEKDLFTTDIFMADARDGKIIRKLTSLIKDSDLDNINMFESAGAWSPDSKKFAFVGFKQGKNVLVIKEVESGKTLETLSIPRLNAFTNPTWSPDGSEIVITGSKEGLTDLYAFNLRSKRARQLTNDRYSEIQPYFSSDGTKLVFSYDKRSFLDGRTHGRWTYDLAIMDYASGQIDILDIFHTADNINPTYDNEDNIYFLSDRDGYRNMYKYVVETGEILQMTDFITGLSGISRYSPVLTASRRRDRVLFTHYFGEEYMIKEASSTELLNKVVAKDDVDFSAGTLPVLGAGKTNIVNAALDGLDDYEYTSLDNFKNKKYIPKFKLDYIGGGAGIGVSNSTFGSYTGLQGGIDMIFSDMLGNHQLFTQLALNGDIYDFGGQVAYLNRTNRVAWGGGLSHIPLRTGYSSIGINVPIEVDGQNFVIPIVQEINLLRIFDETASVFAHLPFSSTLRLEGGVDFGYRSFRWDVQQYLYDAGGFFIDRISNKREDLGDEILFNQYYTLRKGILGGVNVALVGDNSFFGLTAPLSGQRFRISAERNFGINDYFGLLGDYRRYIWAKPFSFAFRAMGYTRFDKDVSSIYPIFIGQMGFVRGYDFLFDSAGPGDPSYGNVQFEQLLGNKMGLASFEIRVPFTGPKQLTLIGSNILFTDVSLFFDAGVAFDEFSNFKDGKAVRRLDENGIEQTVFLKPEIAMSTGISLRINMFGAFILEPYWAYPLQRDSGVVFGLNFIPGW